ncbi:glycosyltransferase family 4 protein [Rubellicoccus peritrichatus]|uniref:Glycosyltransferase family 4 protein n=1 Tax=Rubellicoccus peritrichatus TaxID=3080537 RepID=A0AAQ3LAT7_9BACT|nr:glycosyltransferase family 4 protein [Puniceicoccus sp. CR14]WOO40822.1 glycosyltransferase family 4 protein [Puniceicoccus sp. CR14]
MITLSHPTGNANVRQALQALHEDNLLAEFRTTLGFSKTQLDNMPDFLANKLRRRAYNLPPELIQARPLRESLRLMTSGKVFSIDQVYYDLDQVLAESICDDQATHDLRGVYCYEDGAEKTFIEAKKKGLLCFYEQPIGYWRAAQKIYKEEAELQPEWAATLDGLNDSEEKLARKDSELAKADMIFAATSFTRKTLDHFPETLAPIQVIPYGADPSPNPPNHDTESNKLKVLFVGGLSQRKGLSYLFEAVDMVQTAVELTIIGRKGNDSCPLLDSALNKHTWHETLPHHKVIQVMRQNDVLVFPSIFEGFGLVITEAIAQGIPVITTDHTAGPEVIEDGKSGFMVPIRDAKSIAEKLELLHRDRDRLAEMKEAAWKRSKVLFWGSYRATLCKNIRELMHA